ncbi:hypothetical protein CARUB_v10027248mg [Capsella rubella]|uniref:Uncharacterized protein n=1 Tax=Capsella rubella TaxID=81985 RepID=R0EXW5_9BRAS|nr:hypothetical protein CARUB_v10027248mg [Capsella rubella]
MERESKAPVKDDCHLPERPDESAASRDESASVSNQNLHDNISYFSNSHFESDARRNQLRGSAALVSNQNFRDKSVTHPLSTSYDAKRGQFLKFTPEFILNIHTENDKPKTSIKKSQHVQFGSFGSGMNGSAQALSISEPQMNQKAMDHHYSQPMVHSGNNDELSILSANT